MTAPSRLVVATGNAHKLEEIRSILATAGIDADLQSMHDHGVPEPVEDGATFEANALIKARACAAATGLPSIADDSGLEVDALDGAPGVLSARYAGEPSDDARNNAKLIDALAHVPEEDRTARFVCAAAIVVPDGRETVVRGAVEGRIVDPPRGRNGFGYDPFFEPVGSGAEGRTTAELTAAQKHAISHRGQAFRELGPHIVAMLDA